MNTRVKTDGKNLFAIYQSARNADVIGEGSRPACHFLQAYTTWGINHRQETRCTQLQKGRSTERIYSKTTRGVSITITTCLCTAADVWRERGKKTNMMPQQSYNSLFLTKITIMPCGTSIFVSELQIENTFTVRAMLRPCWCKSTKPRHRLLLSVFRRISIPR